MLDYDESFLFSSVVFGADYVDNQLANLSSLHDAVYSITHIIFITTCVILIFFRGYIQDIVNTAMSPTTSFEALQSYETLGRMGP